MSLEDRFSAYSRDYARFRPAYPPPLFEALARETPARVLAWDCATGNGQAAVGLAGCFKRVVATDASQAQIACARSHPRIEYRVAPEVASGLANGAADLVTVAQALHWLDRPAFYAEARRVLAPGGVVAAWCYGLVRMTQPIDRLIEEYYHETVGRYWAPQRRLVEDGYRSIDFPFEELSLPPFEIERPLTLPELAGYVRTWSATRAFMESEGWDPVGDLERRLAEAWGKAERHRAVWPLSVRAGCTRGPSG
ncbi:MAG: class I SAM-dependent methyltransferase [Gemmatimonadota bacterium]